MSTEAKTCRWDVTETVGRNEFQSRSYRKPCGKPVEDGPYCPKHNAMNARDFERAKAKAARRAAVAERKARR